MAAVSSKNTSIALGDPFVRFAQRKVESGEFASTSEVVREAMRRYVAEDEQRQRLLALIDEGLASPIDEGFDIDVWFEEEFGSKASS
jgi:antitoxin ParD1/3/4